MAVLQPLALDKLRAVPRFNVSSDAHIGDSVWVGGYPFGTEVPVIRRGSIASIVMPEELTVVDRNMFVSSNARFPAYWIDVPIFPGNSGGPVLNVTGDLIGLALETLNYAHEVKQITDDSDSLVDAPPPPRFAPVPVYLDVGLALRLDLALPRTGIDKFLAQGTS